MSDSNFYLTQGEIIQLKSKLNQHNKIEELLKKFVYNETLSHEKNMNNFCTILKGHLNLQNKSIFQSFQNFISNDYNIPIQVNFQTIKYDQVLTLIDQWLSTVKQLSIRQNSDKLYNIKFRNILFSRVFVEERQNIEDHFQTLSQKKMLKPFDLYQLLVSILSHYVLYEYSCDNQTFFQKTNSFNNFIQVVQKFKHSEKRIIIDNKSKDFDYIKMYEFQALVSFWQSINPELQLRTQRRFNKNQKHVQTVQNQIETSSIQIQTEKEKENLNLDQIINTTIKRLNLLTQTQNNANRLTIIQSLCQSLRKQKIALLKHQENQSLALSKQNQSQVRTESIQKSNSLRKNQKKLIVPDETLNNFLDNSQNQHSMERKSYPRNLLNSPLNSQSTQRINLNKEKSPIRQKKVYSYVEDQQYENHRKYGNVNSKNYKEKVQIYSKNKVYRANNYENQNILIKRTSPMHQNAKLSFSKKNLQQLQIVDKMQRTAKQNILRRLLTLIYNNYTKNESLDIESMNKFFIDIGIIQKQETSLMLNLIKNKLVDDLQNISKIDFFQIMDKIMQEDKDLTIQVIQQFVDLYIVHHGKIYTDNKTKQKSRLIARQTQSNQRYEQKQSRNRYKYSPHKVQIPLLPINKNKYRN